MNGDGDTQTNKQTNKQTHQQHNKIDVRFKREVEAGGGDGEGGGGEHDQVVVLKIGTRANRNTFPRSNFGPSPSNLAIVSGRCTAV